MVTKEEIEAIRRYAQCQSQFGMHANGHVTTLLSAIDDRNRLIAKLEADLDRVAPRQKSIGTVYLTPGETIDKLEAKLVQVREWCAQRLSDAEEIRLNSNYEADSYASPAIEIEAILDGKDTP